MLKSLIVGALLSFCPLIHGQPYPVFTPRVSRPPLKQFVMMPLAPIRDWEAFRVSLRTLKSLGISGVTTDICWGLVEKEEGHFDWSYYKHLAQVLREEAIPGRGARFPTVLAASIERLRRARAGEEALRAYLRKKIASPKP